MDGIPTMSVAAKLHKYAKIQPGPQSILDCCCPAIFLQMDEEENMSLTTNLSMVGQTN